MGDGTNRPGSRRSRPWRIGIAAFAALLGVIVVYAVVALALDRRLESSEDALAYDLALEDATDDLTLAVLEVQERHQDLADGPAPEEVADFEQACSRLLAELNRLAAIGVQGEGLAEPVQLRLVAERYYAEFRPSIELYGQDPVAFAEASNRGLLTLTLLERQVVTIDAWAEQRATADLSQLALTTQTARQVLILTLLLLIPIVAVLISVTRSVIAEVRASQAQERAAAEALAAAAQAKLDFLADVSHELRTPLTVLRGTAEVGLAVDGACGHAESLQEIVDEAARMSRLVDDLLFLARAESATPPFELEVVEVAPFLAEVAARAQIVARERGVSLRTDLRGEGELRIDPARIERALMNLIDNAAKHSPPDEPVVLRSAVRAGDLCVEVVDRGPGIPGADLPRIFDRFFRASDGQHRSADGAGLGLAIVKAIADAHGGRVEASSSVGQGTQMRFRLPVVAARSTDEIG